MNTRPSQSSAGGGINLIIFIRIVPLKPTKLGQLSRSPSGFVAAHYAESGGPDETMIQRFDTHIVELEFSPADDPEEVVRSVRDLNPDSTVEPSERLWSELS